MNIEFLNTIIIIFLIWITLEILLFYWISYVRKHFQWLITNIDEKPSLSVMGLKKFFVRGYDAELGWTRKPNTQDTEEGEHGISSWSINNNGARTNLSFNNKQSEISCYGDSFTFCRQVNDDET